MTLVEPDRLRTVVHDGPAGLVLSLHGTLNRETVPGVDSLLSTMRDCGDEDITIDLVDADVDPDVEELIARRWGAAVR